MLGIVLVDKDPGVTSHDVVDKMRRRFSTRRVGHAGTLDPLASGVLVVAVGPATRFLQYLPLEPKEYVAHVRFGFATSTYDEEGVPTETGPVPADLRKALEGVLPAYRGLIEQLPPMYSAVKLNGKPLYTYARRGEEVERRTRKVHIDEFWIIEADAETAILKVRCSGGTYIRTLAHDIGASLGCGAHLSGLQRTQVGRFHLDAAAKIDAVGPQSLIPLARALEPSPSIRLDDEQEKYARDGRTLVLEPAQIPDNPFAVLLDSQGVIVGIGRINGAAIHPECILPRDLAGHV